MFYFTPHDSTRNPQFTYPTHFHFLMENKKNNKNMTMHAVAAASKSLQSCPTLCNPIDGSPSGSPVPGILQARILEWVASSFSNAWKWKVKSESEVAQSCPTLSDAMDCSPPGSSIHGFSRQEYWSGVPSPSPWQCIGLTKQPSTTYLDKGKAKLNSNV